MEKKKVDDTRDTVIGFAVILTLVVVACASHPLRVWIVRGNATEWLTFSVPLFAIGFLAAIMHREFIPGRDLERLFYTSTTSNLWFSFKEEVVFRWIATIALSVPLAWMREWLVPGAPFIRMTFFGLLPRGLPVELVVALAMTNACFAWLHRKQGWWLVPLSWISGSFFSGVAYRFGLPIGIATHFLFNFLADGGAYIRLRHTRRI
jgi:hypothetical protein